MPPSIQPDPLPAPPTGAAPPEACALWENDPREACRRWLKAHEHQAYAPHSIEQYAAMTGHAAQWLAQQRGCSLLTASAQDLDALLAQLLGRGGKPASVATRKRYVAVMRVVMRHLHTLGLREDDPGTQLRLAVATQLAGRQAPRFLDEAQAQRYVDWVLAQPRRSWTDLRDAALRLIYLATGITVNESRQLLITDLRADEPVQPHVRIRAVSAVLARSIALPDWSLPVLRAWCEAQAGLQLRRPLAFPARMRTPALRPDGGQAKLEPISTSEIYDTVRPAMLAAGFEDEQLGPQTLRNTYAVQQLAQATPVETLRQQMGLHTTWSIDTLRREWQARTP